MRESDGEGDTDVAPAALVFRGLFGSDFINSPLTEGLYEYEKIFKSHSRYKLIISVLVS